MKSSIKHGKAADVLKEVPDDTFDSVVTDPDYGIDTSHVGHKRNGKKPKRGWEKAYGPNYGVDIQEAAVELLRTCKPGAHAIFTAHPKTGHKTVSFFEESGWQLQETCIWWHNQANLLGTQTRSEDGMWSTKLRQVFELVYLLRKPPAKGGLMNNYLERGTGLICIGSLRGEDGLWPSTMFRHSKASPREKKDLGLHSTIKPLALFRDFVKLVTPEGGMVCDPFAGSGTAAEAALLERRRFFCIEEQKEFIPLIKRRARRGKALRDA